MKIVRRMSNKELIALTKWVEANLETLHGKRKEDIAAAATAALGFDITKGNIDGAAEALDVEIQPFRAPSVIADSDSVGRPYYLAHAIADLYRELGVPVPMYLTAITHNRPNKDVHALFINRASTDK